MDFERLKQVINKNPQKWTLTDVEKWLEFIGLSNLSETFSKLIYNKFNIFSLENASIDGSNLMLLEDEELKNELNIQSAIVRKKILNWIMKGLTEFKKFLKDGKTNSQEIKTIIVDNQIQKKKKMRQLNKTNSNQHSINQSGSQDNIVTTISENNECQAMINEEQKEQEQIKKILIIQPTEGQAAYYRIGQEGAKIGRHSTNQIIVLEESVSRYHAEIFYEQNNFYIKDVGSSLGTFIKISKQPLKLEEGMTVEIGSNQFLIRSIRKFYKQILNEQENQQQSQLEVDTISLEMVIVEGPNAQSQVKPFIFNKTNNVINIGRRYTCEIYYDDQHLSNLHCKIFSSNNDLYVEDFSSTNGSWLRLSREGVQSQKYQLESSTIFKIGQNQQYNVNVQGENIFVPQQITEIKSDCVICCEQEKDALYLPCRHNAACIRCSKNLYKCPICKSHISDIVKIYKS